jgi:hypothetical protein
MSKQLKYRVVEGEPLYSVYYEGGGQVPDSLTGMWTDERTLQNAIATYENKDKLCKPDQEKKDYRKNVLAAKKRPSKLTKVKADATS